MLALLGEIDDAQLGLDAPGGGARENFKCRTAARAVIFDRDGKIALLHVTRDGYHKLPGGGIDAGEDWKTAICREAVEEIGCTIAPRPPMVGAIVEWRARFELRQQSICGLADVVADLGNNALTDDEREAGMRPVWVTLDQAIALLQGDNPDDYEGKFIVKRDILFLKTAKAVICGDAPPGPRPETA